MASSYCKNLAENLQRSMEKDEFLLNLLEEIDPNLKDTPVTVEGFRFLEDMYFQNQKEINSLIEMLAKNCIEDFN